MGRLNKRRRAKGNRASVLANIQAALWRARHSMPLMVQSRREGLNAYDIAIKLNSEGLTIEPRCPTEMPRVWTTRYVERTLERHDWMRRLDRRETRWRPKPPAQPATCDRCLEPTGRMPDPRADEPRPDGSLMIDLCPACACTEIECPECGSSTRYTGRIQEHDIWICRGCSTPIYSPVVGPMVLEPECRS